MNDQVSLGSQPQYRPQAASAQIAPQITASVQIGKANACSRKVSRSSVSAAGRLRPIGYGNRPLAPVVPGPDQEQRGRHEPEQQQRRTRSPRR